MKTAKYQKRFYRNWVYPGRMFRASVIVLQTDLDILSDHPVDKEFVAERVKNYRRQIGLYIARDERFLTSLKPVAVESTAPGIVKKMAGSCAQANVGPMASVAGAIAERVGYDLLRRGSKNVIVENGGDIFLKVTRSVKVGIFAGKSRLTGKLNLKISPRKTPLGICASSGTVGHSLNFGEADCVIIMARSAFLADGAATAVANRVRTREDLPKALKFAQTIKGVRGAVIVIGNNLATWGDVQFA